ncbi:hypothetical protein [Acidithiobacillus ferridurans]|uniref:Uncharacterized protein n=1 Tax=Acidithiobacillus ferridurans TaxID=1232575 RepID=A0A8X8G8E6_ACIFI|nr:hypothetical protein [Acidithiobacillus ferridurans]MBU2715859.1 hypothetical protein [Acidithiobacillus ferridurans]MBU2723419.1 hypothetical protein [Acidithiobacillus ferridurans]MBU2728048.1 hypothetical protein [Acidithiobacillus ferridurans]
MTKEMATTALRGELATAAEQKAVAGLRILMLRGKAALQGAAVDMDVAIERSGVSGVPWYLAAVRRKQQMEAIESRAELLLAEREYLMAYGDMDIPQNPFADSAHNLICAVPGRTDANIPMIEQR